MAIEGQISDNMISVVLKSQLVLSVDTDPTPTQAKWQWDDGSYILWDDNSYILLD
jgi:hypothetical protein